MGTGLLQGGDLGWRPRHSPGQRRRQSEAPAHTRLCHVCAGKRQGPAVLVPVAYRMSCVCCAAVCGPGQWGQAAECPWKSSGGCPAFMWVLEHAHLAVCLAHSLLPSGRGLLQARPLWSKTDTPLWMMLTKPSEAWQVLRATAGGWVPTSWCPSDLGSHPGLS